LDQFLVQELAWTENPVVSQNVTGSRADIARYSYPCRRRRVRPSTHIPSGASGPSDKEQNTQTLSFGTPSPCRLLVLAVALGQISSERAEFTRPGVLRHRRGY
jgi:hypothetical protein